MSCACNIPLALLITVLVVSGPAHVYGAISDEGRRTGNQITTSIDKIAVQRRILHALNRWTEKIP